MDHQVHTILAGDYFVAHNLKEYHLKATDQLAVEIVDPEKLLVPERIDLICKLYYIDCKEKNSGMEYARLLYAEHIKAFSGGTYTETDTPEKNSLDQYFDTFDKLIFDMKTHGFDASKSVIPVNEKRVIQNGSHRTAIAMYYHLPVAVVRLPKADCNFDCAYFKRADLDDKYLDFMAYQYLLKKNTASIALILHPAGDRNQSKLTDAVMQASTQIIYQKTVRLNANGLFQLMLHLYRDEEWAGTIDEAYPGIASKAASCYEANQVLNVYCIEGIDREKTVELKQLIEAVCQSDKKLMHITRTQKETIETAQVLLNANSIHLMNYGKPFRFMDSLKQYVQVPADETFLQKNAALALYGIKPFKNVELIWDGTASYHPEQVLYYLGRKCVALQAMKWEDKDILAKVMSCKLLAPYYGNAFKAKVSAIQKSLVKKRHLLGSRLANSPIGSNVVAFYLFIRYGRHLKK